MGCDNVQKPKTLNICFQHVLGEENLFSFRANKPKPNIYNTNHPCAMNSNRISIPTNQQGAG